MDERAALSWLAGRLPGAGDDAAVVDGLVLTTDMLHAETDFPAGTTRYTAGWRAVGASLSDLAAMGADPVAAVAAYAAADFVEAELDAFVSGATEVCESVDTRYVGGDLDRLAELTVTSTAVGRTDAPVGRDGATPGDLVCVTGTLGRTAAALRLFDGGASGEANELFRFSPRVAAGQAVSGHASAMMDSSDGLARSLHQLAAASDCGFAIEAASLPIDDRLRELAPDERTAREDGMTTGEDFELVFTVPPDARDAVATGSPTPITVIGETTGSGVTIDGTSLPDVGYDHGDDRN